MAYHPLDQRSAAQYLKRAGLFPKAAALTVTEIGDGNINMVFRVQDKRTPC